MAKFTDIDNLEINHSNPNTTKDLQRENLGGISLTAPGKYRVIRRNGRLTEFEISKVETAMTKAFLAEEGGMAASSERIHELVAQLSLQVTNNLFKRLPDGGTFHIEDIQDQVELALMRQGEHKVARRYVLYREDRSKLRKSSVDNQTKPVINVTLSDGHTVALPTELLLAMIKNAANNLDDVDTGMLYSETVKNLYDLVPELDVIKSAIMSAKSLIEKEPNYSYVASRLLLKLCKIEAYKTLSMPVPASIFEPMQNSYQGYFEKYIAYAISKDLLSHELAEYDCATLAKVLIEQNDSKFSYLSLQTLYDRYFIHHGTNRIELPQAFFMRVAMGLALYEKKSEREQYAILFYKTLSSFRFMSSTPTLFNSGTLRPQLSSCYLTTVPDDLSGIYEAIKENALLSKYAGGLGNDWTSVRSMGSHIKGTNGNSQGVVPFLKVANDTAIAVNQGGKRKGAVCAYLETWHLDIEDFLELRKNTGDDRRRTHDMNTANWIPDLFMKRVHEKGEWTLFSPHETPDLHDIYGKDFEKRYMQYEQMVERGEILLYKKLPALTLWRKMLTMLYETGHPWITFKDPCNIRSPQRHVGVVHSSNLCTEITLNTNKEEIAVCNLGSINLKEHMTPEGLDEVALKETVSIAVRMLDNVIEYNYYSVEKAKFSNLKHRPIGLGLMGFTDLLYHLRVPYDSDKAIEISDQSMETISYFAIEASMSLAKERGPYQTYQGSLWSKGILPIDSLRLLDKERDGFLKVNYNSTKDWDTLRKNVTQYGVRNSNIMAIAPTATIANICGVSASIEPTYQNLYVKSNLSGEFTLINPYLVTDLKKHNIWDDVMINDLKYYDGSLQKIDRIPNEIKKLYKTAFEIDQRWLIECASRRQKWIDQAQSLNLYYADTDAKTLDLMYQLAWIRGLKTTYYLRTIGATHIEKTTLDSSRKNTLNRVTSADKITEFENKTSCAFGAGANDQECEVCQ
ncbi:MAG: ribonucleoside-diphosphate reductase subunit alpha [Methylacidiphilales bacterium]|nr:ribonucleoside-diphosphate reductase subunit alpha [Candidatus Methylacidiphilales bacterium]